LNISLDALTPEVYRSVTGGNVDEVLRGLEAALAAQFEVIKLNCVLMRNVNEAELWPLIEFAAARGLLVRFIELMPVSSTGVLGEENFFSVQDAMQLLSKHDTLKAIPEYRP
jgi:cyclic pyranopterin phosphate synthase